MSCTSSASNSNMTLRERLRLYLVMGSVNCRKDPLLVLNEAIAGGITAFQYREKGPGALTGEKAIELGLELKRACRAHGVLFFVNDDVDLAIRLEADGIHVGQDDEAAALVRRRMPGAILGVSAHNIEEAEAAIQSGADYLGIGPIYPTATKPDARAVQGTGIIREMRRSGIRVPLVGIGGIGPDKAKQVMEAGADGIAVISAISQADSPKDEAKRLLGEIKLS